MAPSAAVCRILEWAPAARSLDARRGRTVDQQAEQFGTTVVAARVHEPLAQGDPGEIEIRDHFVFTRLEWLADDLAVRMRNGGEEAAGDRPDGSHSDGCVAKFQSEPALSIAGSRKTGAPDTIQRVTFAFGGQTPTPQNPGTTHFINRKNGVLQAPCNHATACLLTPLYVFLRNRAMALS
jgi:hypothetical protein